MFRFGFQSVVFSLVLSVFVQRALAAESAVEIPKVIVQARGDSDVSKKPRLTTQEEGQARITSSKKTTTISRQEIQNVTDPSFRKLFESIPGMLSSEVSNRSYPSINYRGLGDPHESQNLNQLEDGLPISADPWGYPAVYYSPDPTLVDQIEFFRGGSGLLYGPHASGALNFRSKPLQVSDAFGARSQQTLGAFGFFSSSNEISTPYKIGETPSAVKIAYVRRQMDGFRPNMDSRTDQFQLKNTWLLGSTVVRLQGDYFDGEYGEAGGLARAEGTNRKSILQGLAQSTTLNDRLYIRRQNVRLDIEHEFGADTEFVARAFYTDYSRLSRRQNLGGAPAFGGIAQGSNATVQDQDFNNLGLDARVAKKWSPDARTTVGVFVFDSSSTFNQRTSDSPTTTTGTQTRSLDRGTHVASLFTETEYSVGEWKVTPGLRLERVGQTVNETLNTTGGSGLKTRSNVDWVPLAGMGLTRDVFSGEALAYFNASQGYRPVQFSEGVPLLNTMSINQSIDPARTVTGELGLRNDFFDVSAFFIRYDNRIGSTPTEFVNTGAARHFGVEGQLFYDLNELKSLFGGKTQFSVGGQYLNARYTQGPFLGLTPQYAPMFTGKFRVQQFLGDRLSLGLSFLAVSRHFGDDTNTSNFVIPGYGIWDMDARYRPFDANSYWKDLSVFAGMQNIFDRQYWTRVRSNGIDPAMPFTFQAGVQWQL